VSSPGADWVEQLRRFIAALAAEHAAGADLADVLGDMLGRLDGGHPADGAPECSWCPLCAGLAALRGRRPDLLESLADVLTNAAGALRTTARATPEDGAALVPAEARTAPPEEAVPRPAPGPTVQRIVIG
jgi:hypothetical protein